MDSNERDAFDCNFYSIDPGGPSRTVNLSRMRQGTVRIIKEGTVIEEFEVDDVFAVKKAYDALTEDLLPPSPTK